MLLEKAFLKVKSANNILAWPQMQKSEKIEAPRRTPKTLSMR